MTGDDKALSAAAPHISSFLSALPAEAAARADWSGCLPAINEALTVPTQVLSCLRLSCPCGGLLRTQSCANHLRAMHKLVGGHLEASLPCR